MNDSSASIIVFTGDFVSRIPYLVAWTVAVILAVMMVRRRGGKAEKLFLTGSSLMFASTLASPLLKALLAWLVNDRGASLLSSGWVVSVPLGILSISGVVCMVYAFWVRFRTTGKEAA